MIHPSFCINNLFSHLKKNVFTATKGVKSSGTMRSSSTKKRKGIIVQYYLSQLYYLVWVFIVFCHAVTFTESPWLQLIVALRWLGAGSFFCQIYLFLTKYTPMALNNGSVFFFHNYYEDLIFTSCVWILVTICSYVSKSHNLNLKKLNCFQKCNM